MHPIPTSPSHEKSKLNPTIIMLICLLACLHLKYYIYIGRWNKCTVTSINAAEKILLQTCPLIQTISKNILEVI